METDPSKRKPNRAFRGQHIQAAISEAEVLKVSEPPDPTARAVLRGLRVSILAHIAGRRGMSEEEARRRVEEFYPVEYGELGIGATDLGQLKLVEPVEPDHWNNWNDLPPAA